MTDDRQEQIESSNLVAHARAELGRAGWLGSDDEWTERMGQHLLRLVEEFALEGHSGTSAAVATSILPKLLAYENLTPITDDPAEWQDVSDFVGEDLCWQSRRNPTLFSEDGGRTYYSVDKLRRGWRRRLLGKARHHRAERAHG